MREPTVRLSKHLGTQPIALSSQASALDASSFYASSINEAQLNIDIESMDIEHNWFTNQMQMFAHYCNADNAFVYLPNSCLPAQHQTMHYGEHRYAKQQDLAQLPSLIPNPNYPSHWFNDSYNRLANQNDLGLLLLVASDCRASIGGILGCYVDKSREEFFSQADSLKMLAFIAQGFANELNLSLATQALQQKQISYSQIVELNQDLICVKDENHRFVYANKALLDTFENSPYDSITGLSATHLYEPEVSAQIIESDLQAFSTGSYKDNQLIRLANQQERIFHTTKKTFTGINKQAYMMSISRDVTDKEILISDLKRSNDDLDNFAYVASHDLRSPLNVIHRLTTYVLEDCADILPLDSKENLDLVLNRAQRMEKLLVDLLSYSRIGKEYQEASELNLRESVIELLSLIDLPMGFAVNCDNINIVVPAVPFNVVMLNLLANAIKHHDSGNAKIEIKAKKTVRGCVISILDNGPGIQEQDRKRIFQLFETLRPRDEVEGSGMGLSVVKKIVEHYGGNIAVEDNQPRGTKFVITWPLDNMARAVLDTLND